MADLLPVNDINFTDQVMKSSIPVLVDFWAEWCAPCRMIAPYLGDIAKEYAGKILVVKMDVDESPETPSRYSVTSIPTLIVFQNGSPMDKLVGAVTKNKIKGMIDGVLG
jgi:thioredoxin 1